MRFFGIFVSVLILLAAASAADLRIKVVDPQSGAVAGAQVELFRGESSTPVAIQDNVSRRVRGISRNGRWHPTALASWLRDSPSRP